MSLAYPDNDNRERRAIELVTDCNSSLAELVRMEGEIDRKIKDLDKLAQDMIMALEPSVKHNRKTIDLHKTVWKVSEIVTPALMFTLAYKFLSKAAAAKLVANVAEEGGFEMVEIGATEAATAAEELSIPMSAKIAGALGGAVLAVGVGFAIDAIEGKKARDKLRDKIHSTIPFRVDQKVNEQQVRMVLEEIGSMVDAYEMMKKLGYDRKKMDELVDLTIKKFKPKMEKITKDTAKGELAKLDSARGSWTNEDS